MLSRYLTQKLLKGLIIFVFLVNLFQFASLRIDDNHNTTLFGCKVSTFFDNTKRLVYRMPYKGDCGSMKIAVPLQSKTGFFIN